MQLMTKALEETIPALYAQEDKGDDAIVYAHWFSLTGWDWYCTEYDPAERLCFGLVKGFADELGYWTIDQLEEVNDGKPIQLIERDLYWKPCKLSEIR